MSQFVPSLFQSLRSYRCHDFLADLGAGLTVGAIALPLAIGFGIASGVTPGQGLWTAIVAGFLIALLGGSRFQVSGPTGAFVPVLFAIVARHQYEGLAIATVMAGVVLVLMGLLKMGRLMKFVPFPVISGFTSGIAVIIFCGQLKEFLGLTWSEKPEHVPDLLRVIATHLGSLHWQALAIGALSMAVVFLWPRVSKKIPASIIAVLVCTGLAHFLHWDVLTIDGKYQGGIPSGWPGWHVPHFTFAAIRELIGPALTIAALGGIESLLSAMVADGMTDTRHDSNQELIAQGIGNMVVPFVGGIAATGAIARTAANIRNGARSPVSALIHAFVLLGVALFAARWAGNIPLACLSGILLTVAMRMAEWDSFPEIWRTSRSDFGVLLTTFLLTVVFDLTVGVGVGMVIAVALFVRSMESMSDVSLVTQGDDPEVLPGHSFNDRDVPEGVLLYRLEGPLFFAAVDKLEGALRRSGGTPRAVIFRLRNVPSMDASGLKALRIAFEKLRRDHVHVLLTAVQPQPLAVMRRSGLIAGIGEDHVLPDLDSALTFARFLLE